MRERASGRGRTALAAGLLIAALAALFSPPARSGEPMSSPDNAVPRSAVGGGTVLSQSTNNRLDAGVVDEIGLSTTASAGSRLGSGYAHVLAFPFKITDLADRGDVSVSSVTLQWTSPGVDGERGSLPAGSSYYIRVASYTVPDTFALPDAADVIFSTSGVAPGELVAAGKTGLQPNTTYWARIWTKDGAGNMSYASDLSTFTTLALPVSLQSESFVRVYFTSVTVQWSARPSSPPDASSMSASGYLVEASSTNFGTLLPGGVVSSSSTPNVALSTLTVSDPGLVVDRTYYFRVGALNWAGVPNWTVLGATDTKFHVNEPVPADPPYSDISTGSITARWDRNGNPGNAYYYAEVSTAPDFTGVVTTTDTYELFYSTGGLAVNTTYYFRVFASTRGNSSAYASLGSTMTWAFAPAAAGTPFGSVHVSSLTARWLGGGNPPGVSTFSVVATTSPAYPNLDDGNVILLSTRPAGSDPAATLSGLEPNTTYFLFAAGVNAIGAQGSFELIGTTATRPAPPAAADFEEVSFSSVTASWSTNGNPLGVTTYTVVLSTVASYPGGGAWDVAASTVPDSSVVIFPVDGLLLNVTYHLYVTAEGHAHRAYATDGSTATKASEPGVSPNFPTYDSATTTSFRLNFSSGLAENGYNNALPPATTYFAQLSLEPDFDPVVAASITFTTFADFPGLLVNTTYFAKVTAFSHHHGTWTAYADFGSSATLAAIPATAVTTFTSVAFTSMTVSWSRNGNPVSMTTYTVVLSPQTPYPNSDPGNFVLSTAPVGLSPTASFDGLNSATTYYLFVAAVNPRGVETAYAALGSTRTSLSPKTWAGACNNNWYNPACWSPAGVPGANDAVTIGIAASVVVTASSPSISFSSLTLGSPSGAVAGLTIATTIASGGSVLIYGGAGLTQSTTRQLVFDGDFTMLSGSSLTHTAESATSISSVNVRVTGTFDLQAGATINVMGKGYRGGAVDTAGFGPGAGGTDTANGESGGGAGHGGYGGTGVGAPGGGGGGTYGSQTAPVNMGSGGGGAGNTGTGGSGGGVVIIDAAVMSLDGVIISSGNMGMSVAGGNRAGGGGGSGGGVFISAAQFSGSGSIDASGGGGGLDGGVSPGGGGGGGRVSVVVSESGTTCGLNVVVAGGASGGGTAAAGNAGTFNDGSLLGAAQGFSGAPASATSVDWTWTLATGATDYQIFSSTGGPMSPPLGAAASYTTTGLAVNTTASFYVQARACGANVADSAADAVSTLATLPAAAATPYPDVGMSSASVSWTDNGNPVDVTTYTVVLTTEAAFPNAHSGNVTLSTLPAGAELTARLAGLYPNSTYYLFVAAVNHAGLLTSYANLGGEGSATLALPPSYLGSLSATYPSVQAATVAVSWGTLPASPPDVASATCAGYLLEISSTNFGQLSPGGVVVSSVTPSPLTDTLVVAYPDASVTTNYYRVSSLNWSSRPTVLQLGKLNFQISQSSPGVQLGSIDMNATPSLVAASSIVVTNAGDLPATFVLAANMATLPSSPWTVADFVGIDSVTVQGLWNTGPPAPPEGAFTTFLTPAPRASQAGGNYAGDQDGVAVPPGQSRTLWFRVQIPSSTSSNAEEVIGVDVQPVRP